MKLFRSVSRPPFAALLLAVVLSILGGCGREEAGISPSTQPTTVPVAPRPATRMLANGSCITPACHASLSRADHIHGPVSRGTCETCHSDDIGGHVFPLKRQGNALCTFCHAVSGQRKHQHAVVDKNGCMTCHQPHASKTKFLLKADSVQFLCLKCHDLPLKKYSHEPFAAGQCTTCHEPHEADARALLRGGDGPAQCFTCHKQLKDQMAKASDVHRPAAKDCLKCHDAHASDHPRELKFPVAQTCLKCHKEIANTIAHASVSHSAATAGAACANCHNAHASMHGELLNDRTDKLCDTCHAKPVVAADGRQIAAVAPASLGRNLHGPLREGKCTPCHQVHGGQTRALLTTPFPNSAYAPFDIKTYALCFRCHQKELVLQANTTTLTNFRDGSRNLHFLHVNREDKGRSCKTCHEIHGSDQPNHLASSVQFEGSAWAMPMNYEKASDGGSCTPGCHARYSYSRNAQPTTRPTDRGQQ